MVEALDALNPLKGVASNAMVLFLAINTAGLTLLPTSVVALRATAGSLDPAGIVPTTIFATLMSMIVAIITAKLLQRFFPVGQPDSKPDQPEQQPGEAADGGDVAVEAYPLWMSFAALLGIIGLIPVMIYYGKAVSPWIIPVMIVGMVLFGYVRRVSIYEAFIEGATVGNAGEPISSRQGR